MYSKEKIKINGMLLLTALLWGSSYAVRKMGLAYMGPFFFNSFRFFTAFILVIAVYFIDKKINEKKNENNQFQEGNAKGYKSMSYQIGAGVLVGIAFSLGASLQQWGLLTTDAGKVGFITSLYIIIIPIMSWLILKKKIKSQVWIGGVVAFIGLALITVNGTFGINVGDVAILVSAVLFAAQMILIGHFIQYSNPLLLVAVQMLVGFVISLIFSVLFETGNSLAGAMAGLWPIIFTGLGSLGVANIIQFYAQKKASPSVAAIILSSESVFGAFFGMLLMNEHMNGLQITGCFLILIAVLVAQYEKSDKTINKQIAE